MAAQPRRESDAAAKVVLGLSKTLASTLELDEVLVRVLDSIGLVLPLDSGSVFLIRGHSLEVRAAKGAARGAGFIGRLIDLDSLPLNRSVIEGGEPIVLADAQADPRWNRDLDTEASLSVRAWMGLPLLASGQVIGMLSIDSKTPGSYGEAELGLASSFADLAAVAVRNARLFSETRRRLGELDAVNKVGAAVASRLDVDELCEVVGAQLQEIFRAGVVYVAVWQEEAGLVRVPFYAHDGRRESYGPFPYGEGLASLVLKELETLYIARDVGKALPALGANALPGREPMSWLGVPILSGKRALGVLCVQSYDREKAFSDDDVRLLTTIASTVGAGIRNARLYEEARRKAAEAAAIAEAGREIGESLDPDEVLRRIAQRAHSLLSRDTAAVFLTEADGALRAVVSIGAHADHFRDFRLPPGAGIVGRVVLTGSGIVVNDVTADTDCFDLPGKPVGPGDKLIAAPLSVSGRVAGVMAIWRSADEPVFLPDDLVFLSGLARQAAVAIANARLHRRATEEARRAAMLYESASAARAEAEEADRLKSRFLANMTHELRTPLNSIINLAYLIQEGDEDGAPPPPAIARTAARIEAAGRHLLGLINEVLDFSKIEAGRMDVRLESLDLRSVASSVLSEASGLERAPGVELLDEIPEDLPSALADRVKLRQVLFNLLANAVKFTPSGSIALRASASEAEILVEVEDTGIGMDPEDIPKAFAEFVQLDDDMDRRVGGSGLGLPLSRQLVELQGGKLWAESRKGAGSTFRFTLRRAEREPPRSQARRADQRKGARS
jgi:signal transduction histidine kinase/putative methionine-R-sulfoxide reductase with GAF domain